MNRVVLLVLLLMLVFSCGPSGQGGGETGKQVRVVSGEAKSASDLMPIAEGNAWTYHVEVEAVNANMREQRVIAERTLKVAKVTKSDVGTEALIEMLDENRKTIASFRIRVNDSGVYQLTGPTPLNVQAVQFDPPLPWIIWGAKVDQRTEWGGTGPLPGVRKNGPVRGAMKGAVMYKGEAEVDGMYERFKTLRYDSAQTYTHDNKEGRAVQIVWFSPKVGIVRMMEGTSDGQAQRSANWRVKSYTVK